MKTKVKRLSRRGMSAVLTVILVLTCLMVGNISTKAYGGGTLAYTVTKDDDSTEARTSNFTLSNNTGTISLNFTDAKVGSTVTCTLTIDSDVFGENLSLTQGNTGWMKRSGTYFTIKVTAKANVSFNILQIQPGGNPPSLRYSITDNVPDYYLVGTTNITGQSSDWVLNDAVANANQLEYNSTSGLYQKTYTLSAKTGDTTNTYKFKLRNKGRSGWDAGSTYGYSNLVRPITDNTALNASLSSPSDDNIVFTLKSDAKVTIGISDSTSRIYITIEPAICTVTTSVTPALAGTATVNNGTDDGEGGKTFDPGDTVSLTAASSDPTRYVFSKWTANNNLAYDDATSATPTAVVSGDALARAEFTKRKYDVTCTGDAHGSVSVGETTSYAWGDKVDITVTPDSGYTLDTLTVNSGAVTVDDNSFTMPVGDAAVVATFRALVNRTVTYGTDGNGYVSVGYRYSDTHDQITQSVASGSTDVLEDSELNFCAIPKPGYKFDGWYTAASGGTQLSTTKDETITVSGGNVTRYAHFTALDYKPETGKIKILIAKSAVDAGNPYLNVWNAVTGDNNGTFKSIPTGTYYTIGESNYYLYTMTDTSTAVKCTVHDDDWNPESKELGSMASGNTYRIEWGGTGQKTGGALYTYSLPTAVYPVNLNVTNPEKASDTHVVAYATLGSEVDVTATPADDTKKVSVLTANSVDIKATKKFNATSANPNAVQVTYDDKPYYTVTYTATEGGTVSAAAGGTKLASGDTVMEGTSVTFTATPEKNYIFSAWSGADTSSTNPKSLTINSDTTIQGNFTEISYQVVDSSGNKISDMKKLPNGTWISTSTVASVSDNSNTFTIKRLSDNYYSHSGAGSGSYWLTEATDNTVSGKANARWYDSVPTDAQLYTNHLSSVAYVVYDPNASYVDDGTDQVSNYKGRLWVTTNDDGLYPAYVYLKDGTVRSGTACSSLTGVTTLVAEGTTAGLTAEDDSDYGTKTVNSATEYLVKKVLVTAAQLRAGVKLHIRTDVIDQDFDPADATKGNGKDYYVKGFDVDGGLTQAILEQEFNDDDEKTEKASYDDYNKIHGVGNSNLAWNDFTLELNGYVNDKIEVTPIYFKRAEKSTDNIRLYVQDFVGAVKEAWRGALAVYPYLEGVYDPYGGYPGTLMVNEGGRYMIDVPANYVNGSGESTPVQGLTLNNYIWDDVHNKIYFSDVSNRSDAHYQTYDYNEFEIINKIFQRDGLDEDIIFTFKYKDVVDADDSNLAQAIYYRDYKDAGGYVQDKSSSNYQKYSDGTIDARDYRTIQPTLSKAELADSKYQFENLADMYGNRVDIMGNLVDIAGNDEKAAYNPIHIISNGYDYSGVGKYATAWAYYMPVDDSGNPAWTGDFDHYALFEVMGGQGNQTEKYGSESYLIDPTWSDRIIKKYTNQVGTATIMDCENVPCVITYEYTIQQDISNLKDYLVNVKKTTGPSDEDKANKAYRSDGRWLFSNSDQLIKAHTAIAIVDSTGKIYTRDYYQDGNIDYTKGGYDPTEHTGLTTRIQAYFTNDGTETVEGREISNTAGNTECNSISDGAHTFDMTTVGDPDGDYEFVGWYYYNGTDYKLASESMTYSQEAKANDVFVAVYKRVSAGTLVVTHSLHENSDASADCYATVQVKDKDTVKYTSERTTDQIKIGPTYIKYNSSYNLVITLETEPENDFIGFEHFYKTVSSTISQLTAEGITGVTSSVTLDEAGSHPTATITVPIAKLFDQEDGEKPQTTKALRFYSKVDYNTYTYEINYKYPAYNPSFGTQGYRTEGTFTNDELKGFMKIDSGGLTFKTNSDRADFINNKAPYEKNFMQTIGWNTSAVTQSYASNKLTIDNVNAVTTDAELNLSIVFPYEHDTEANEFAYTEDSANTGVKLDEADTVPVRYNKPKFNELLSFNEYKTIKDEGDPQLLAAPKMIVDKNGTPEDPSDDDTYYFRYWSVKAAAKGRSSEVEYTRCYNYVFDYVLFQNTVIEPVYTVLGAGETADSVTPISELNKDNKGVTISFIENSRNQYNGDQHSGAPYEDGVTHGTPSASRQKGADVVYSDFLLSFNNVAYDELGPIRLDKLEDGEMEAGLIIERVGAIGEGGVLSEEEYRALYGDTITNISATGGSSGAPKDDLVKKLNSVIGGTTQTGYLKSAFDANEVDNKNRVDYYYGLLNRLVKDANHYEYDSYKSNRDNVYRAYAYIKKTATTPAGVKLKSESSDDASFVISQVPVYFTIYDIASIENGGMLS